MRKLLLLMALLAGCGSSTTTHTVAISASGKSCTTDSDCVPAFEGPVGCCGPDCPNSAINMASYAAYQADLARANPMCYPPPPCVALNDIVCRASAVCRNGTCEFSTLLLDGSTTD
jgi:hypothetical protein